MTIVNAIRDFFAKSEFGPAWIAGGVFAIFAIVIPAISSIAS